MHQINVLPMLWWRRCEYTGVSGGHGRMVFGLFSTGNRWGTGRQLLSASGGTWPSSVPSPPTEIIDPSLLASVRTQFNRFLMLFSLSSYCLSRLGCHIGPSIKCRSTAAQQSQANPTQTAQYIVYFLSMKHTRRKLTGGWNSTIGFVHFTEHRCQFQRTNDVHFFFCFTSKYISPPLLLPLNFVRLASGVYE